MQFTHRLLLGQKCRGGIQSDTSLSLHHSPHLRPRPARPEAPSSVLQSPCLPPAREGPPAAGLPVGRGHCWRKCRLTAQWHHEELRHQPLAQLMLLFDNLPSCPTSQTPASSLTVHPGDQSPSVPALAPWCQQLGPKIASAGSSTHCSCQTGDPLTRGFLGGCPGP